MSFTASEVGGGENWERAISALSASPLMSGRWLESLRSPTRHPIYLRLTGPHGVTGAAAGLVLEPSAAPLRPYGRRAFFYTGPALSVDDPGQTTEAVQAVVDFARRSGMAGVVCRSWDFPHAYEFPKVLCHRSRRKEFVLDLSGDLPDIEARMRPQVHRQRRQALNVGLTFHESHSEDVVAELLGLLEETRAVRLAKGCEEYDYFYMPHLSAEALTELVCNGIARGFVVRRGPETVSALLVLVLGPRAVALLAGTKAEGYRLRAPSLLWPETARQLKQSGVTSLNLLGVPSGPDGKALAFFKQSLGCGTFPCADGATGLLQRSPFHLVAKLWSGRLVGWS